MRLVVKTTTKTAFYTQMLRIILKKWQKPLQKLTFANLLNEIFNNC